MAKNVSESIVNISPIEFYLKSYPGAVKMPPPNEKPPQNARNPRGHCRIPGHLGPRQVLHARYV